jgi:CelD/BcsL family acetyltransferase involved in cellulose biosynthesis
MTMVTAAADGGVARIAAPAGTPVATGAVSFSVHADLAAVEAVWRPFQETAERTVFQSFDWLATWQREIGALRGTTPAIVIGRGADGAILFILPLAIERRRLVRRLTFLASDLCDYNAPLLSPPFLASQTPESFRRLWAGVRRALRTDLRFRYDLADLQKMPETIGGRPNPFRALPVRTNPSRAYITTLGSEWEAYYAERRSSATRKTERKQGKRLAEQGAVVFVEPKDAAERVATIDTLVAQKRRALARMGADDIFDRPGYVAFYRAIAGSRELSGMVHVDRLDVGSETGAASVTLIERDTCAMVLSSYNDGPIGTHGPGRAHLHALMRRAIDRGLRTFDFTIGDEPYKRDWCDREVTLYDHLAPASLHAMPIVFALSAFRTLKRTVKQTPALWHAFTRLRARR